MSRVVQRMVTQLSPAIPSAEPEHLHFPVTAHTTGGVLSHEPGSDDDESAAEFGTSAGRGQLSAPRRGGSPQLSGEFRGRLVPGCQVPELPAVGQPRTVVTARADPAAVGLAVAKGRMMIAVDVGRTFTDAGA